jgi:outer membrane immunogenic protein
MQVLRTAALTLLLATILAPGAMAADLGKPGRGKIARVDPVPLVEDVSPFSWTGLYVGGHVGYGWSDIDWREEPAFTAGHDGSGWLAGGQVGYNWQRGRLVFGIEADISSSWIEGGSGCCGHGINWLTSVRGRAGLASYDNRWLFYATAGAAWADVDYSSAGFAGHSETQFGWVAGAGIERALTPNLTARIEYLYYDFDGVTAPAGSLGPAAADLDPSMHAVRFGLNFKF